MKIYTSYFAKVRELERAGVLPVSVARFSPKWFTGPAYPALASGAQSLLAYKAGLKDARTAREEYCKDVLGSLDAKAVQADLKRLCGGKDAALCCYERPGDFCHRQLICAWLNENGVSCREYEFTDTRQPELFAQENAADKPPEKPEVSGE